MSEDKLKLQTPDRVEVYTDGGCRPNPGPGGWGAIARLGDREWTLSGNDPQSTNNQMEMQAALSVLGLLESLFGRCSVDLYTDSEYLRQGITEWIGKWERNGWQTRGREPVKNRELWQVLDRMTRSHSVTWHWVQGHAGHPLNERADRLATRAREALRPAAAAAAKASHGAFAPEVEICVKASYLQSQKAGGWAVVLRTGEHQRTLSQQEAGTANALLIRGAAEGLWALTRPCSVAIYSDADYLIRGASQWIKGWQSRGWTTRDGKPVANRAEWEALLAAMQPHRVIWQIGRVDEMPDLAAAGELAAAAAGAAAAGQSDRASPERPPPDPGQS